MKNEILNIDICMKISTVLACNNVSETVLESPWHRLSNAMGLIRNQLVTQLLLSCQMRTIACSMVGSWLNG